MGLLDRLRTYLSDEGGSSRTSNTGGPYDSRYDAPVRSGARQAAPQSEDERAVERYRYLLRTAPPDAVEEVHAEAFAKLTPDQRRLVFEDLSRDAAPADRPASDDPRTLARSATRSELRQPGFLERTLGSGGGAAGARRGPGLGTMIGGSLLGTVAGVVIGSAIADMVLPGIGDMAADFGDGVQDVGQDIGGGVQDVGQDVGDGFGDFGDFSGGGGDFGDFGGGDF